MKLSKLEAYRIYSMSLLLWPLVIRYEGDQSKVATALDDAWVEYYSKINKIPKSSPTLVFMVNTINKCPYLSKYLPSPITQPVE